MKISFAIISISLVAELCSSAEDQYPHYFTAEQKTYDKKLRAKAEEAIKKVTPRERAEINILLKGLHQICAEKEKILLYGVEHESIGRDARSFGESRGWAQSTENEGLIFTGSDPTLPASIRRLNPSSVFVSNDRVHIEFGGALQHQGLTVFRNPNIGTGTVKVGKGIWYTSDDNRRFVGQPAPKIPE